MVSIAVNDTDFMSSMPPKLTAATGMDALTHAIEAALSKNANPLTDKDAYWAMQAIVQNLPRAVANGQDEAARTMMAYAENVAGMAFSNAGLGMVHATTFLSVHKKIAVFRSTANFTCTSSTCYSRRYN